MRLLISARAKINWSLGICGERDDGYHELDMLMQRIELCDELSFERARWLTLSMDGRRLPCDERNLVIRAANALNEAMGLRKGARIHLRKNIPSRAGLGGGSADCAATLLALNRLWELNLPLRTLQRIGLTLGADVPYCLQAELARVQGIGERITPCGSAPRYPLVLITPGGGLSTPAVFKAWNAGGYPQARPNIPALSEALSSGALSEAAQYAGNDLEAPAIALMPEIAALMARFRALGAPFVRMSGSGSTVFAAFTDEEAAQAAQAAVPGSILTHSC